MKCTNIYFEKGSNGRAFNCGKCHACRVNETSKWTLRCLFELDKWAKIGASFVTLTYDDEHLPKNLGLQPDDLTKFWKRLRVNLVRKLGTHYNENGKEVTNTPIVYRACGEYGDKEKKYIGNNGVPLGRPHYHAIVFGLDDLNDTHRQIIADSWGLCDPYLFDKCRGRDSAIQPVTREDIAYVCGYVQKKLNDTLGQETYGDRHPPFSATSQGIGLDFAIKNKEILAQRGYTTLNGQKIGIPRYFRDKLGIEQQELIRVDVNRLKETNELVFNEFYKYLAHLGLSWLTEDPIKNASVLERRFNVWWKVNQEKQTELIEQNYKKWRQIRGKADY